MTPARHRSPGRRLLRLLKWLVPLALVVGLLVLAFCPRPLEVDLGEVTRGPMMHTVDEDGTTRVRERYVVSAPLAGRLLRVELDPGDCIEKAAHLATLDPGAPDLLDPRQRAQAEARLRSVEASLERAERQLETAQVDADLQSKAFARAKTLFEKGNIRQAAMEEAESSHLAAELAAKAAASAVKVATFDLEQARAALIHTRNEDESRDPAEFHFSIHSPIDGLVLRVFEESSTVVTAGTPLLEIGDPADLELRIDVLSQDAVRIRPGQRVLLEHWGGDRPLNARVRLVEPSAFTKVSALGVDEQRVNVIADLEDAPAEHEFLGDAFRVEARVVTWESSAALRVPAGALFRTGEDWTVYRVVADRAELVTVTLGHNNGSEAEVLDGLSEGDRIILHPGDQVADGSLVSPRN